MPSCPEQQPITGSSPCSTLKINKLSSTNGAPGLVKKLPIKPKSRMSRAVLKSVQKRLAFTDMSTFSFHATSPFRLLKPGSLRMRNPLISTPSALAEPGTTALSFARALPMTVGNTFSSPKLNLTLSRLRSELVYSSKGKPVLVAVREPTWQL
ncbi:MAG: hypothetical protein [Cressdnaviricota sp.]|nr:MAG: hypothetical protein [Cressdnaviricota sp.]